MQNKIQKLTGKNVETLYLTPISSVSRHSTVNFGQRRQIFKPRYETRVTTGHYDEPFDFLNCGSA